MFNDNSGLGPEDIGQAALTEDELDLGIYRAMLQEEGMSEEVAARVVVELFHIMRMCVEMGVSTDLCGQLLGSFNEIAAPESGAINSSLSTSAEAQEDKKGEDHEQ